jgi:hypothetical protein
MTELAHRPDDLNPSGFESARQIHDIQRPSPHRPVPGDSFSPHDRDLSKEKTSELRVFYNNVADNLNFEIHRRRESSGSPEVGNQAELLLRGMLRHASQPPAEIPVEGGRETISRKDDFVLNAVGKASLDAARTMMDPDYDGRSLVIYAGTGGSTVQNDAIYKELEGIFDLQPSNENNEEFDSNTVPGAHVTYGPEHELNHQRPVYLRLDRSGIRPQGRHHGALPQAYQSPPDSTPSHGRHRAPVPGEQPLGEGYGVVTQTQARFAGTEKNPVPPAPTPPDRAEPTEAIHEGGRGRHEYQAANTGAQIYHDLLSQAPAGPDAYPGIGLENSREIRDRLRLRIDHVTQHPLPQLEHDQTGETADRLADSMRRVVDFIDPRYEAHAIQDTAAFSPHAGTGMPEHSVVYQGPDPRGHDTSHYTSDLVRMEILELLGTQGHHTDVRNLDMEQEHREQAQPGDRVITTVTVNTEFEGVDIQIQILDGIGFDLHNHPGTRMRINLNRPPASERPARENPR